MKRLAYLLIVIIITSFCFPSCKTIYPTAEVNYLTGTEQTVTVRAVGIGINEEKAIINAEQKVFEVLFFRGLPESAQKLPMIGSNESEEKAKHKDYFKEFYDNKRHKTFVMSSIPVSSLSRVKEGKMISVDIKVNLSASRNDLETFGIVRKFGF